MEPLAELALLLGRLGLLAVGGSTVILGELNREVVHRGWMSEAEFAEGYALTQLVPGPGALFVIPVGYKAAGWPGAAVALAAYLIPPAMLAIVATLAWGRIRDARWPRAIREGLLPVAVGLAAGAAYAVGAGLIRDVPSGLIAAATMLVLLRSRLHVVVPLVAAALVGAVFLAP